MFNPAPTLCCGWLLPGGPYRAGQRHRKETRKQKVQTLGSKVVCGKKGWKNHFYWVQLGRICFRICCGFPPWSLKRGRRWERRRPCERTWGTLCQWGSRRWWCQADGSPCTAAATAASCTCACSRDNESGRGTRPAGASHSQVSFHSSFSPIIWSRLSTIFWSFHFLERMTKREGERERE